MKRAFFVIGPESSGTRMMTQAFLSVGCFGDGGHRQRMDRQGFKGGHESIAFRRSVPHGRKMPQISKIVKKMQRAGYEVVPVLIARDKDMCSRSQVSRNHAGSEGEARASIKKAIDHTYRQLAKAGLMPMVVFYEPFVKFKSVRAAFFRGLGLPAPKMDFFNSNLKYG